MHARMHAHGRAHTHIHTHRTHAQMRAHIVAQCHAYTDQYPFPLLLLLLLCLRTVFLRGSELHRHHVPISTDMLWADSGQVDISVDLDPPPTSRPHISSVPPDVTLSAAAQRSGTLFAPSVPPRPPRNFPSLNDLWETQLVFVFISFPSSPPPPLQRQEANPLSMICERPRCHSPHCPQPRNFPFLSHVCKMWPVLTNMSPPPPPPQLPSWKFPPVRDFFIFMMAGHWNMEPCFLDLAFCLHCLGVVFVDIPRILLWDMSLKKSCFLCVCMCVMMTTKKMLHVLYWLRQSYFPFLLFPTEHKNVILWKIADVKMYISLSLNFSSFSSVCVCVCARESTQACAYMCKWSCFKVSLLSVINGRHVPRICDNCIGSLLDLDPCWPALETNGAMPEQCVNFFMREKSDGTFLAKTAAKCHALALSVWMFLAFLCMVTFCHCSEIRLSLLRAWNYYKNSIEKCRILLSQCYKGLLGTFKLLHIVTVSWLHFVYLYDGSQWRWSFLY